MAAAVAGAAPDQDMWDVGYYLLGIKQTSNKKDNERIARHAANSKCPWNWLNNGTKKKRAIREGLGRRLSGMPQTEDTSSERDKELAGMKGTTIAHNFHLLFGYTFGHIMSTPPR